MPAHVAESNLLKESSEALAEARVKIEHSCSVLKSKLCPVGAGGHEQQTGVPHIKGHNRS